MGRLSARHCVGALVPDERSLAVGRLNPSRAARGHNREEETVISSNPNCEAVMDMLRRQYNERDLSAVDQYIAEDHGDHNPMPGQGQGRAAVRQVIGDVLESAETINVEIHDCFGEGDMVATRYTVTVTPKEKFFGVDARGKTLSMHIVGVDRLQDLQIIESWGESNMLAVLQAHAESVA